MRAMNVNIQLDAGEVFQFSALYEGTVYKDLGTQPTITIRFVERIDENGTINNVVLSTIEFTPKWNGTIERYTHTINHKWQATRDCNINMIVVDVTVKDRPSTGSGTGGRTRFYLKQIQMGWGNADAATAPNYSNPDKGDLESLEDKEQELESNTAEGQEEVQEIISPDTLTSTLLSYAKGLQFTSRIMLSAITKIPFLNALIWVSMSLGFVATLFALSASIIAASDRRAGSTARAGKHSRR